MLTTVTELWMLIGSLIMYVQFRIMYWILQIVLCVFKYECISRLFRFTLRDRSSSVESIKANRDVKNPWNDDSLNNKKLHRHFTQELCQKIWVDEDVLCPCQVFFLMKLSYVSNEVSCPVMSKPLSFEEEHVSLCQHTSSPLVFISC